jgi:hypothetical protein
MRYYKKTDPEKSAVRRRKKGTYEKQQVRMAIRSIRITAVKRTIRGDIRTGQHTLTL